MKKKIGYKVLKEFVDGTVFSSSTMLGCANAHYYPQKIIKSKKFNDGDRLGYPQIRLPLLVFCNLGSAKKFVENIDPSLKIWKVCYIRGKMFAPATDVDALYNYGVYFSPRGHNFYGFPEGTDFASCLKMIEPVEIKEYKNKKP